MNTVLIALLNAKLNIAEARCARVAAIVQGQPIVQKSHLQGFYSCHVKTAQNVSPEQWAVLGRIYTTGK